MGFPTISIRRGKGSHFRRGRQRFVEAFELPVGRKEAAPYPKLLGSQFNSPFAVPYGIFKVAHTLIHKTPHFPCKRVGVVEAYCLIEVRHGKLRLTGA